VDGLHSALLVSAGALAAAGALVAWLVPRTRAAPTHE
jgi:hypothetical protein